MKENKIVELMNKWFNLLGIDPNKGSFSGSEIDHYNFIKQCKLSLNYDPHYITTLILLKHSIKEFLIEKKLSYLSIIENSNILNSINKYKELYLEVNSLENNEIIEDFKNEIKEKVNFYKENKIDNEFEELLNSDIYLSELRLNALTNLKNMQEFQFYKGLFSKEELKFSPFIYEFYSVNSLVNSLCNSNASNLITLSLIRDKITDEESYFAFGIKNGQNIYVLTDKEKTAHPRERYMRRNRAKDFVNRADLNMFPYDDVLNFDVNAKGSAFFCKNNEEERKLSIKSNKPTKIKHLNEVNCVSFVWIVMMLDVIKETYFSKEKILPELSYTDEILFNKEVQKLNNKSLMIYNEKSVSLEPLKNEELSHELLSEEWERKPSGVNNWIEDKFKQCVDLNDLNLLEDLNHEENKQIILKSMDTRVFTSTIEQELEYFKLTEFGTLKELKKNQKWIARYNQALNIEKFNRIYFEENKQRVIDWYKNKLIENIDNLLEYLAKNELIVKEEYFPSEYNFSGDFEKLEKRNRNILSIYVKKELEYKGYFHAEFSLSKMFNENYLSLIEESKTPSLVFIFNPVNIESLLKLCNVSFEELPEELQHWTKLIIYSGNSITDHIDPMEWVVKNYWNKLNLSFSIYLTKTEYGNLRKKHGLENNKFW